MDSEINKMRQLKNYNCNAKSQDISRAWSDAASLVQSIIKKIEASPQ
jgi:hypothetical protein